VIAELSEFTLDCLPARDVDLASAGGLWWSDPSVYLDVDVTFRQYYCPGCYTAVEGSVSPVDHPPYLSKPVLSGA
jgi:N-methylhydantoinase B